MGFFRFRRNFKIAPDVRLNLADSGMSTSAGGLSYAETTDSRRSRDAAKKPGRPRTSLGFVMILVFFISLVLFMAAGVLVGPP